MATSRHTFIFVVLRLLTIAHNARCHMRLHWPYSKLIAALSPTPAALEPGVVARAASPDNEVTSTTTITVDCPSTLTVTIYPSSTMTVVTTTITTSPPQYTTSLAPAACTGTSASCPCSTGYACMEIGSCTWACATQAPTTTSPPSRTWTYTHTASGSWTYNRTRTWSYSAPASTASANTFLAPCAGSDASAYGPCVPGTFICTDAQDWETCVENADDSWAYGDSRAVAAGMMCLPNLSPYGSGTSQYAQQAMTPQGYYRDDRIVRARPDGSCSDEGAILCTEGGQQFDVCDQGGWVRMGDVAAGTVCEDGEINSA